MLFKTYYMSLLLSKAIIVYIVYPLISRPPLWQWSSQMVLLLAQTPGRPLGKFLMTFPHRLYDNSAILCVFNLCFRAYIANRVTDKLTKVTDYIYCCRSGSAADTQAIADIVNYHLNFHKYVRFTTICTPQSNGL